MDALDQAIRSHCADAYVAIGSSRDAEMRYLSRFTTTDPIVFFKKPGQRGTIIVSQMECERAARESEAAVMSRAQAGLLEIMKQEKNRWKALALMIAGLTGGKVLVPSHFPYGLALELAALVTVEVDPGTVEQLRAKKNEWEVGRIRAVQTATDLAMERAIRLIRNAKIRKGILFQGAVPLSSEKVRAAMHRVLLDHGCLAIDTIVACGEDTAVPHNIGSGALREGVPIVIDVFPMEEASGYYSDMTRTVCRGEPSPEIRDMYEAVRAAQDLAASRIRPGVSGEEVHSEVVDFFSERGYASGAKGFVHNLGHGVGLEVHESPSLGPGGGILSRCNVVTNEPGLYYPGKGGIRLEDTGLVTASGFSPLTRFTKELTV
jgi:Xaa-Pro aminopeptidase